MAAQGAHGTGEADVPVHHQHPRPALAQVPVVLAAAVVDLVVVHADLSEYHRGAVLFPDSNYVKQWTLVLYMYIGFSTVMSI